jgi:hypothetical protein
MPRRTSDMPKRIVSDLTQEQESRLPIYRDKWRSVAISTERVDQAKAAAVLKAVYVASDYREPEILFYTSPFAAIKKVFAINNFKDYLGRNIHVKFRKRVLDHVRHQIAQQLNPRFFIRLQNQVNWPEYPYYPTEDRPQNACFPYSDISTCMESQLVNDLKQFDLEYVENSYHMLDLIRPADWSIWGCMFDFCIAELGFQHDKKKWSLIQELIQNTGFIFQFEKVCIVCDRPSKLSFDSSNHLHAENEPALQFADGYSIYACHGRSPFEEERYSDYEDPDVSLV